MVDHIEQKALQYNVAQADSPSELAELVNAHMTVGWRPVGGVSVAIQSELDRDSLAVHDFFYVQAMVRP